LAFGCFYWILFLGQGKVGKEYVEAPALPTESPLPPKTEKEDMEDFLDDLLG
jgi:hypothetical protein